MALTSGGRQEPAQIAPISKGTSKGRRKYHLSSVSICDSEDEDWLGTVLPPYYRKEGSKRLVSDGTRLNTNGLLAHLFFWDKAAIPRPKKVEKLPEDFELLDYCHNQILASSQNDRAFRFVNEDPLNHQTADNKKGFKRSSRSIRRAQHYSSDDLEWENQVQTFFALEAKNPGKWSVSDPNFRHAELASGRSLLVRLYDSVPIPAEGVHLLDIIEFKSRYRQELKSLRARFAELFLKIEGSPDMELSFEVEFSNLRDATLQLEECFERSGIPISYVAMESRLFWNFDYRIPLAAAVAGGALDGLLTALVAGAGGALANLVPQIEVSAAPGKLAQTGNPLAYSYLISKRFGSNYPFDSLSSPKFLRHLR